MWTQILAYFLLILFVMCYVVIGYYIADLLGNDKSEFKTYLIGVFWPVVIIFLILILGVLFVVGFFRHIGSGGPFAEITVFLHGFLCAGIQTAVFNYGNLCFIDAVMGPDVIILRLFTQEIEAPEFPVDK